MVLLRDDSQEGLQVFFLRRHMASAVLGGAFVFLFCFLFCDYREASLQSFLVLAQAFLFARLDELSADCNYQQFFSFVKKFSSMKVF